QRAVEREAGGLLLRRQPRDVLPVAVGEPLQRLQRFGLLDGGLLEVLGIDVAAAEGPQGALGAALAAGVVIAVDLAAAVHARKPLGRLGVLVVGPGVVGLLYSRLAEG